MRTSIPVTGLISLILWCPLVLGQPRLIVTDAGSYQVGDFVDPEIQLLDSAMNQVKLGDLVKADTRVVVIVLFGGSALRVPKRAFRGPLWCEDSFDDLAVQRAVTHQFREPPVQFVPVAIPPVYSPGQYGFSEDVFLGASEESAEYRSAVKLFITATEVAKEKTVLPFEAIYYDPKGLTIRGKSMEEKAQQLVFGWQGKLKWHLDPRKYGTPTLWVISRQGRVLTEPFVGNDYDSDPPVIPYTFRELKEQIEKALGAE